MLSTNEMMAMERFINLLNEDETNEIKYFMTPILRGQKIWAMKVVISSIACEMKETTVKVYDMMSNFEGVRSRIYNIANVLERNIFAIS